MEVGRVCMKTAGREAGRFCVVVRKIDETFVEITGPKSLTGVKRRRANVAHLEPLPYLLDIKEGASDAEVIEAYKKANLVKKLNLKLPSEAEMKGGKEEKKSSEEGGKEK